MLSVISKLSRRYYPDVNTRVTLPFLVAIVVVAMIGVYIVTRLVAGSLQERFSNQLADSASAAINTVIETEQQQLAILRQMVFTDGVFEGVLARDAGSLQTILQPFAFNQRVEEVTVFDFLGAPILTISDSGRVVDLDPPDTIGQREGIQRILTKQVDRLGDKFVDIVRTDTDTILYFAAPVVGSDGIVRGGITVGITTSNLILNIRLQALSDVVVYATDGTILGDTFPDESLETLKITPEVMAKYVEQAQTNPFFEQRLINDTDYQMLYTPFVLRDQTVGLVMVALPIQFISQQIGTSRTSFILLFGGLFVGIGLLGLWVARSIVNPVNHLVNTTRAIRSGDLSRRVDLTIPDELGELAVSFDHMTDDLVKSQQEIQKLYYAQVQETARRDAILAGISDAVVVLDNTNRVFFYNKAAEALMKTTDRDLQQRHTMQELFNQPQALFEPRNVSLAEHYYSVLATPVVMDQRKILGHVMVFRDITAIIQAERLKDEMIRQLSHELRTPITAARGYADLVLLFNRTLMNAQGIEYLGKSTQQMDVLSRMVNTVIEVSAMLANDFEIEWGRVDIHSVVKSATDAVAPLMQARGLRLTTLLPRGTISLDGDAQRIEEVLTHILHNSANFTLENGWVEISVDDFPKEVHIMITDNGVGIDRDELEKVFERMVRGRSADAGRTDTRGLGLGLYISRHIIDAHHGKITLSSQRGFGTIVTIVLPKKRLG